MPLLTAKFGSFPTAQAYDIQAELARRLSRTLGPVVGYKVGYASKAAQQQFGMKQPASGPLFLLQRVPSGTSLPAESIREVMLETEVAFTLGRRIGRPVKDVDQLRRFVRWAHTAFDCSEQRFAPSDAKPTPQDMIASGLGAHYFVLGPAVAPSDVDVDSLSLTLQRDGVTLSDSPTTNVMGSPWKSLLWLVNHAVELGTPLRPGMVVVTGTAAPAFRAKGPQMKGTYVGRCGKLGQVTLTIR